DVRKRISHLGSNTLIVRPARKHRGGIALQSGSVTRFTIRDSREIREIPGVIKVAPCVGGNGQVVYKNKNWNTRITGTTVDHPGMWDLQPKIGRYFTETETTLRQRVAVIGQTVVENLFGTKNPIGEFIKIRKIDFQIIGILPVKGSSGWRNRDDEIFIPLNTAMYRLLGRKYIDYIDVQVSDSHLLDRVTGRIKKLITTLHRLPSSSEDTINVMNMTEIQETISSTMKTFSFLLGSIA
ncbi:unnamed protein product, partial [marine sediment metagenome]